MIIFFQLIVHSSPSTVSRVEKIFQHSKRNFVSPHGHVISSIYEAKYDNYSLYHIKAKSNISFIIDAKINNIPCFIPYIKSFHHLHNICLFIGSFKTGEIYSSRDIFQIRPVTDGNFSRAEPNSN